KSCTFARGTHINRSGGAKVACLKADIARGLIGGRRWDDRLRPANSRASCAQKATSKAAVHVCSLLPGYRVYLRGRRFSLIGNEKRNTVPWGAFAAAERRPPCA